MAPNAEWVYFYRYVILAELTDDVRAFDLWLLKAESAIITEVRSTGFARIPHHPRLVTIRSLDDRYSELIIGLPCVGLGNDVAASAVGKND